VEVNAKTHAGAAAGTNGGSGGPSLDISFQPGAARPISGGSGNSGERQGSSSEIEAVVEAAALFAQLAVIDPVRANYYSFRRAHALGQLAPKP